MRSLGRWIKASLQGGSQFRAAEVGASIESLLASDLPPPKVVVLVQAEFLGGSLAKACACQMLICTYRVGET